MTAVVTLRGLLAVNPECMTNSNGRPRVAVAVDVFQPGDPPAWLPVSAVDDLAEKLLQCRGGDTALQRIASPASTVTPESKARLSPASDRSTRVARRGRGC